MTGHTPLPWSLSYGFDAREFGGEAAPATYVGGPTPEMIGIKLATPWVEGAWDDDKEAAANAEFIVRACNSHYVLSEALEPFVVTKSGDEFTTITVRSSAIDAARAAIARTNTNEG